MDQPVAGGRKHGDLMHQSVVGSGDDDDSFGLHSLVKKLQQMQAGRSRTDDPARTAVRVNNWNTTTAKSMEWRSFLGVATAGTGL